MGFRELAKSHGRLIDAHNQAGKVIEAQGKVLGEIVKGWNEWHQGKRTVWQRLRWLLRGN